MTYVDSGGLRLFYSDSGSGPPVLWHTGGCGDSTMWQTAGYVTGLPGYRHLLFDHRGHGRSAAPATMTGHQMSCYVDDVITVLDDAGVRSAVMIGYSMGARVGYAVAAAYPQRLAGIVGLDSVPNPAREPDDSRAQAARVLAEGTKTALQEMADSESEPPPSWLLDNLSATDPAVFAGAWEAFATAPPFWADAGRITVPTLFLLGVGEDEQEWWELGQAAAAAMPDAEAVALPGLGHLQAFWKTGMSLPPIERFLARLGADGHDWH